MRRAALLAALVSATLATVAIAATGDTLLAINATGQGGILVEADALTPSLSADGRYVAFNSDSGQLHRDDRDTIYDVFVRDRVAGRTILVSRGNGARGVKGDEGSGSATISADGRYVAYDGARDIGGSEVPDEYSFATLYVRDLKRERNVLISRASGARGRLANNASYGPRISADGRVVVFHSEASNLDPADRSEKADVFVRHLRTNRTELVSRASGVRGRHANAPSENPSISADGRLVAFESRASNLDRADQDFRRDVFVRDLETKRTVLVSPGAGVALEPAISADGRFVAFTYYRAADLDPADTDRRRSIYVKDLRTGKVELVSRTASTAWTPAISADGRRVAFASSARDLDPADTDRRFDVYVYDRTTTTTALVSRASGDGPKAAGPERLYSGDPTFTADGRFLAFESNATNLHPDDTDEGTDIFLRDLGD